MLLAPRPRHRAETIARPRWFRGIAMALAVLIPTAGVALGTEGVAQAAVVQWGTGADQSPNYQATVNGDFTMTGNGVLACTGSALTATNTSGSCTDLHANNPGTGVSTSYNDYFKMVNSNTVSGFTTNSSTGALTIPAGATVAKAYLDWSANTGVFTGAGNVTCSGNSANGSQWYATRPDAASGYRTQGVQFKVGSGAIQTVAPQALLEDPASQASALYYSASADVTSAFANATTGSALNISAGNIWAAVGAGCYAGWSLTVVYDYGKYIPGNAASAPHRVIYYQGHVREAASDSPLTVNFTGFSALQAGVKFGYTLYEGDRGITGDYMRYTPQGGSPTEVLNTKNASGNIGVGQADGSVRYTQTSDTSTFTNQSVDVHTQTLSGVDKGDTSMTLTVGTSGDSYLLQNAVLSVPTAALSVVKTLDGSVNDQYRTATENTAFTITVTNNGSVSLSNIQLTFPDTETCTPSTTIAGPLASGATATVRCTGPPPTAASTTSSVTATAQVTSDTTITVADTGSTNTYLSSLALTKTSALASGATGKAGDTVNYTFTATNNGTAPLTGVAITDPLSGLSALTYGTWPSGTSGTLQPGQAVTATATYTLTQTDVDAGSVANTATVTGTDPDGGPKPTATASRTQPLTAANALTLTKAGALASGSTGRVGDTVNWTFRLTNSGAQTITGAAITDQLAGVSAITYGTWPSGTTGRLTPGQTVTATATSTLTQAQVDAGTLTNTATAAGRSATGSTVTAPTATATVAVPAANALVLTKSGAVAAGSTGRAGDTVNWSFTLRNAGNQTVTSASITDRLTGVSALTYGTWPSGTSGTLAPGQTVTATATYALTQTDVDAGSVVNTAGAAARGATGGTVTAPDATATVAVTDASSLTIVKDGTLASGATGRAGDTVNWTFTVTNAGNRTLTGVTIADPLAGISTITYGTWASGTTGKLAPGQSVTATATSTLTQAQVNAGSITNTATATGTNPSGTAVTSGQTSKTVNIAAAQKIALEKTGALATGATGKVGDTVNWQFSATNTGNTTLYGVAIADGLSGISALTYSWPGTTGQLDPNQTVTATATSTLTQADVDAGSVVNTATGAGNTRADGSGQPASSTASATVAVSRAPGIAIAKTGALASGATGAVGDTVTYTFTVRNAGNTTLTGVTVADPLTGLSTITYAWPGTAGRLTPGQSATATATYKLTQKDVDAGYVQNTATATGTAPNGTTATNAATARTTVPAAPGIAVSKTGALASGATGRAGDTVNYTFTARNTGNQTLTAVSIGDALTGVSTPVYGTWPSGTAATLAPGQSVTATATYTLTQADVDAGSVVNTARATATTPTQGSVSATSPNTLPVPSSGALTFTKTGAVAGSGSPAAGGTVNWTFSARNTGNVTLTGVAITDQLAGLSAITYSWPGTTGRLAPGQTVTAAATSTLTQAQIDAGTVRNTATIAGTTPGNTLVSQATAASVSVDRTVAISVAKSGALDAGSTGTAGDRTTWTLRITNTGTTTLTSVGATDSLAGLSGLTYSWPGTAGTLAPGQSATATATGTVSQTDLDAGSVTNTATATGSGPSGTSTATAQGSGTIPLTGSPALGFTKSVTTGTGYTGRAGDTLTYAFRATNSGNQTLTGVTITDPHTGLGTLTYTWPGAAGRLAPGQSVTATASYTVTQADVDAGAVANRATVSGITPQGTAVSTPATATQTIAPAPGIAVSKSAVVGGTGAAGDTVTYRFDVANTGTTTLTGVGVSDQLAGLSGISFGTWPSGTTGTLAPGQTVRGTATYAVTQSDVDAGSIVNTATSTATTPTGGTVRATGAATVTPASGAPAISLAKTERLATSATGVAGDTVRLGYTITNSGNQTLTNVTLTDEQSGHSAFTYGTWPSGTAGTLGVGQSVTVTATYTLTQADVDRGTVSSDAATTGVSPGGTTVRATDTGSVGTKRTPAVSLTETGSVTSGSGGVGSVVTWTYQATNTGTVTLTIPEVVHALGGTVTYAWPNAPNSLAPGQTVTATTTSTVTQADVDAGALVDTSSVTGTAPTGTDPATVSATAAATVPTSSAAPGLAVTKAETFDADGSTTRAATAGDQVDMRYVVTNTGNVTLTVVGVQDAQRGISSVVFADGDTTITLAPGRSATATATYTLSQSDVDAGGIRSAATAFGTTPAGTRVTATATDGVTITPTPAVTLTKTARYGQSADGAVQSGRVGDTVVFSFLATNTGSVTLSGLALRDQLIGLGASTPVADAAAAGQLRDLEWSGGTAGSLAPGERLRATASYTVTQADVDAGAITNTATVTGTTPAGATTSRDATVTIATDADNTAAIGIVKDASVRDTGSAPRPGDPVDLRYTVTNTGDYTLTGVGITDAGASSGLTYGTWPSGTTGTLTPGQTVTATAVHTLTQADIDAGYVTSPATTRGTPSNGGAAVTATSYRTVPVTQVNTFDFTKSGVPAGSSAGVGDDLRFTLTARNTGNTTLDLLQMTDQLQGVGVLSYTWPDPSRPGVVAPGEVATATAAYTISQADVDAGSVVNTANAVASPPAGAAITKTATSTTAVDASAPTITLDKTEAVADGAAGVAGDTVRFGYTITNTGTTTLTGVGLTDEQQGLSGIAFGAWPSGTTGTLAPGQSVTATASYRLTQADVDRAAADTDGHVALSSGATTTATDRRSGAAVSATDDGSVVLDPTSTVSTRKTAAVVGAGDIGAVRVGDVVRYTVTATNTGQTTLTGVTVDDPLSGLGTPTTTWPNATAGRLSPGQAVVVTADRTVTQDDVDAGSIANTATTTGTTPAGTTVSGSGTRTVVTTTGAPGIGIQKTETNRGAGAAGDTVDLTFTVTNTGDVTLTGVGVTDSQQGLSAVRFDAWPGGTAGRLAPGQSVVAHATYTLTQQDVDRGGVASTATTTGTPPRGADVAASDDGGVTVAPRGTLSIDKTGSLGGSTGAVGDTVRYTFRVANTGNVTVTAVAVSDVLAGVSDVEVADWPAAAGRLAPGQGVTGSATYRVTQADVDAGSVLNDATVTGSTPTGDSVTASDAATVALATAVPGIRLDKTEQLTGGATGVAGDTVRFGYTITNTGTATLSAVELADAQVGLSDIAFGTWPTAVGTLAPGQSVTATASYTLTQADVDRGSVASTATTTGTGPTGTRVGDTAQGSVALTAAAGVGVTKRAAYVDGGTGRVGDTVRYTFTVTNTGQVTLGSARVTDRLAGLGTITVAAGPNGDGSLAPGQALTATAGYTVTQADVDAGAIVNQATVTATPARGADVTASDSATIRTNDGAPAIALTKTEQLAATGTPAVGDTVRLGYTITNTGNQTLRGVVVADAQTGTSAVTYGTWPGTAGTLAPGQSVTATATYALTQADLDAGRVASAATATGTAPTGGTVRATDTAGVDLAQAPELTLLKQGRLAPGATGSAGEGIRYTFTATNTGNVTVTLLDLIDRMPGLSDPTVDEWPGAVGVLAPGQTVTASATYTITQSDVDAGAVTNTATVVGRAPDGSDVTGTDGTTVETAASGPRIGVVKTAVLASGSTGVAGDRVEYTYAITNTGNVTLTGVTARDDQTDVSAVVYGTWPGTAGRLAPGETVTATASHVLTQAEVDRGTLTSTVTAAGNAPGGTGVSDADTRSVTVAPSPSITLSKTAAYTDGGTGRVGDTVRYTFRAQNTGTVTLTGTTASDRLAGLSAIDADWPGTAGTLAPGAVVTATATYTVTQADVDAGSIVNQATVVGNPPTGAPVTATDGATIRTADPSDAIALVKDERVTSGTGVAGDTVTLTFTVSNPGNRTLTGVTLDDDQARLGTVTYGTWPGSVGTLAPGQSVTATATYTLTQADVDRGSIASTATTTATVPSGEVVTATADGGVDTVRTGSWTFDKTGVLADGDRGDLGDRIDWTYRVTNTGTVTLTDVSVADALPGVSAPVVGTWPNGTAGQLLPGQSVTATARSTVAQSDVDAGSVVNTATADATVPTGATDPGPQRDSATVGLRASTQQVAVTKTASLADGATGRAGDTVDFGYVVTNTGTSTLRGVTLADAQTGTSAITIAWPGTTGVLAPGESARASAAYVLTQADVDRGTQASRVTATGTAPGGATVDAADTATVTITARPAVDLTEEGALAPGATGAVGDTVQWTYTVTNSGTVSLGATAIAQQLPGSGDVTFGTWPGTPGVLAPGQTVTATATSTITQAQFDAGRVTNPATASGTAPDGAVVTADASATVGTGPADARIGITKTAALPDGDTAPRAGDVVTYTYRVTNSGTSTLSGVGVADAQDGVGTVSYDWPGTAGVLAPGQVVTATATYALTQADVDRGSIASAATATGTPPTGTDVTASAGATLVLPGAPELTVTKDGALADGAAGSVGDTVDYRVTIRNTGTTTLRDVAASDPLPGLGALTFPAAFDGTLAPGADVVATAAYTVTQDDVDAGSVVNTATATANPPTGGPVSAEGSATVTLAAADAGIDIVKTQRLADGATGRAGDQVTYTFTITNTAAATLRGITVADGQPGLGAISIDWPAASGVLRPGQTATGTATYTLTQQDVDRGSVSSTATTTGTTPAGATVRASDDGSTTITGTPGLTVTKSGAPASGTTAGRGTELRWTIDVRNSGTVTLTGVAVTDDLAGFRTTGTAWPGVEGTLAPGETARVTGTSTVGQADVDAGGVVNTARATGTAPDGVVVDGGGAATVPTDTAPAGISIVKTASLAPGATGAVGDTVRYHYVVTNGGDTTLRGVTVRDAGAGVSAMTYAWPGEPGVLLPGETVEVDATVVVTQADVDAGSLSSPATVVGTAPDGTTVTDTSEAGVSLPNAPHLTLDKRGVLAAGATGAVGDRVDYTFTVTNDGSAPITDVTLDDGLAGLTDVSWTWPGTAGTLAPGEQATGTASYRITQADVDAGGVVNTATVGGTGPGGTDVTSGASSATAPVAGRGSLTIDKTVQYAPGTDGAVGQQLQYGFTLVNTGTVTLRGVHVEDRLAGLSDVTYGQWPGAAGVLAPGQRVTATATYVVGQADGASGSVENSATAIGTPQPGTLPGDGPVTSAPDTVRIAVHPAAGVPALAFTGSDPVPAIAVAALLVALGIATAAIGSRRRTRKEHR
ncbi:CARDB domain-containing protein [Curtobacterium sp. 314Chir4.1]|uniref:DUF7507 domain-containing protein n=1 Tax=Curtobacterium sp. 314Chir4.1 TaxID=1279028 RepID=UPI000BE33410|nr:CARDB domain-containing protein [Curtobacterium sp. 314Chir4.1]